MSKSIVTPEMNRVIAGFFQFHDVLVGHPFYAYQTVFVRRILETVLNFEDDDRTITGLWSRQSGKTTAVAEFAACAAILLPVLAREMPHLDFLRPYKDGVSIGIFAPVQAQSQLSYDRIRTVMHSEIGEEILGDSEIDVAIEQSRGDTLALSNGSGIKAKTASPDSKIEGATYHIILCDESQALDRFKVDKEIEPMRAATNGVMVKIGTAWLSRGGFHSDIEYNVERWKRGGPRCHFEFDYRMVCQEKRVVYERDHNPLHLAYERYVEQQKRKQGESSLAFRLNFMLKWQESNLDAITPRAMMDSYDKSIVLNDGVRPEGVKPWARVAGIDIAKSNDFTVVSVLEVDIDHPIQIKDIVSGDVVDFFKQRIAALLPLQGDFEDHPDGEKGQYTFIINFLRQWGVRRACVDATAMGDPVFERLSVLAPEIEFEPIHYSTPVKSDIFKHYLQEWESGRFKVASGGKSQSMPEWQAFYEEHKNLEKNWSGQYLQCSAPEPTSTARRIEQKEYHDDYPNSGALAAWAAKGELQGEVRVDSPWLNSHTVHGRHSTNSRQQRYGRRRW